MGEVHARSWIVLRWLGSQQAASSDGTESGRLQSTACALQTRVLQRQVGFSTTRA
jgi:hypothetical protein